MSLGWNPIYLQTNRELLERRFNELSGDASRWAEDAINLAGEMADLDVGAPEDYLADLEFEYGEAPAPVELPELPEGLAPVFEPDARPVPPSAHNVSFRAPSFSGSVPSPPAFSMPAPPQLNVGDFTGEAPGDYDVGQVPEYVDPAPIQEPILDEDYELPPVPVVDFDQFAIQRPDFDDPLDELYTNEYIKTSTENRAAIFETVDAVMLDAEDERNLRDPEGTKALTRLGTMLDGGTGLPAEIEQALFDRAIAREQKASMQAMDQALGEWARRGFTMPGATVLQRLAEVRQANREAVCVTNREITIQMHQEELQNLRFAVERGIALQGQMFQQYIALHEAGRQTADRAFDVARSIFDAKMEVYRMQLAIYETDVRAFAERIRGELSKIELYKGQLEALRVRGELNEQKVRIYTARVGALQTFVDAFTARVTAYKAKLEARGMLLDEYRAKVEAYGALVQTDKTRADIYDSRVRAEVSKADLYRAQVQGFAERVNVFRAQVDAESARTSAESNVQDQRIRRYQAEVDAWRSANQLRLEQSSREIENFRAKLQAFQAQVSADVERVRSATAAREADISAFRARADVAIASANQLVEQLRTLTALNLGKLESASRVISQLAASAMSAVNISASVSDGSSSSSTQSSSYGENVSRSLS